MHLPCIARPAQPLNPGQPEFGRGARRAKWRALPCIGAPCWPAKPTPPLCPAPPANITSSSRGGGPNRYGSLRPTGWRGARLRPAGDCATSVRDRENASFKPSDSSKRGWPLIARPSPHPGCRPPRTVIDWTSRLGHSRSGARVAAAVLSEPSCGCRDHGQDAPLHGMAGTSHASCTPACRMRSRGARAGGRQSAGSARLMHGTFPP